MSRIFNWTNKRAKKVDQIVRFKETERIVTEVVLVPQKPVTVVSETETTVDVPTDVKVEADTTDNRKVTEYRTPEPTAETDGVSRMVDSERLLAESMWMNGEFNPLPINELDLLSEERKEEITTDLHQLAEELVKVTGKDPMEFNRLRQIAEEILFDLSCYRGSNEVNNVWIETTLTEWRKLMSILRGRS